ncbi:hypothetical protein S245_022559 [Arachis hypogaea]|uniref:Uncharacterized protein n=1 Tax=Arachis hypogaea TaxID=3818 RepID=A0A445C3E5_ARAHY|nr:hypothetical protein Ahy_A07g031281 [Arachis hypogaea]
MALYISNLFGCFSESSSSESKRYKCDGNVCVLRNPKEEISSTKRSSSSINRNIKPSKRNFWTSSFSLLSPKGSQV